MPHPPMCLRDPMVREKKKSSVSEALGKQLQSGFQHPLTAVLGSTVHTGCCLFKSVWKHISLMLAT